MFARSQRENTLMDLSGALADAEKADEKSTERRTDKEGRSESALTGPPDLGQLESLARLAFRNKLDLVRANITQISAEQSILKMYNTAPVLTLPAQEPAEPELDGPKTGAPDRDGPKAGAPDPDQPEGKEEVVLCSRPKVEKWNVLTNKIGEPQTFGEVNAALNATFVFPAAVVPVEQQNVGAQAKFLKRLIRRGLPYVESCLDEICAEIRSRKNDDAYATVYNEYKCLHTQVIMEGEAELETCTDAHFSHGGPFSNVFRLLHGDLSLVSSSHEDLIAFLGGEIPISQNAESKQPAQAAQATNQAAGAAEDPASFQPQQLLGYMINNITKVATKRDVRAGPGDTSTSAAPGAAPPKTHDTPTHTRKFSCYGVQEWAWNLYNGLYFMRKFHLSATLGHIQDKAEEVLVHECMYVDSVQKRDSSNLDSMTKSAILANMKNNTRAPFGNVMATIGKKLGQIHRQLHDVFFGTRQQPARRDLGSCYTKSLAAVRKKLPENFWYIRDYCTLRLVHYAMCDKRYGEGLAATPGLVEKAVSDGKRPTAVPTPMKHLAQREERARQALRSDPKSFLQLLSKASCIWANPNLPYNQTDVTAVPKDLLNPIIQTHAYAFITQKLMEEGAQELVSARAARSVIKAMLRWPRDKTDRGNMLPNGQQDQAGASAFRSPYGLDLNNFLSPNVADVDSLILSMRVDATLTQVKHITVESITRKRNLLAWEFVYEFLKTESVGDPAEAAEENGDAQAQQLPASQNSEEEEGPAGTSEQKSRGKRARNVGVSDTVAIDKLNELRNFFLAPQRLSAVKAFFADRRECVWFNAREVLYDLSADSHVKEASSPLELDATKATSAEAGVTPGVSAHPIDTMEKFLTDHQISLPPRDCTAFLDATSFVAPSSERECTIQTFVKERHAGKICTFDLEDLRLALQQINTVIGVYVARNAFRGRTFETAKSTVGADDAGGPGGPDEDYNNNRSSPGRLTIAGNVLKALESWTLINDLQAAYLERLEEYVGNGVSTRNCNMHVHSKATSDVLGKSAGIRQPTQNATRKKAMKWQHIFSPMPTFSFGVTPEPATVLTSLVERTPLPPDDAVAIVPEVVGQYIGIELVRLNLCSNNSSRVSEAKDKSKNATAKRPTSRSGKSQKIGGKFSPSKEQVEASNSKSRSHESDSASRGVYAAKKLGLARALQYYAERRFSRVLLTRGSKPYDLAECGRLLKVYGHIRELLEDICDARKRKNVGVAEMADLSELVQKTWESNAGKGRRTSTDLGEMSREATPLFQGIADARYKELGQMVWAFLGNGQMPSFFPIICFLFIEAKHQRCFYGSKLAARARIVSSFFRLVVRHLCAQYAMLAVQENVQSACASCLNYFFHILRDGLMSGEPVVTPDRVLSDDVQGRANEDETSPGAIMPLGSGYRDANNRLVAGVDNQVVIGYAQKLIARAGSPESIQVSDIELLENELENRLQLLRDERDMDETHRIGSGKFLVFDKRLESMQIRGVQLALFHLKNLLRS